MDSINKKTKTTIEEEAMMPGASSEDELLASSQETVAVESSTLGASRSTVVLKPTAGTSRSEASDGLVASSLEPTAVKLGVASTRHSTPDPKPSASGDPSKAKTDKNVGRRKPAKKRRSTGVLLKSQYQKAMHILGKIAKNKEAGTVDERDEKDLAKYQAIVDEYNSKRRADEQKAKPIALKRNRSQDEVEQDKKRSRVGKSADAKQHTKEIVQQPSAGGPRTAKTFSDVARSHLWVALADGNSASGKLTLEVWTSVEARLSGMVYEHLVETGGKHPGLTPHFDSSHVVRGFHVIACMDQFSKDFLGSCVAKISDAWEGVKLKIIPYDEIPRRPVARIWLPKIRMEKDKLVHFLRLHNPGIPMDDWVVIKEEEPQINSQPVLLRINEECLEALKKADYKVWFGVRNAKVKVFRSAKPDDDLDPIDAANELLEEMTIDGPTGADKPPTQADHAEGNADKSAALEVCLG